MNDMVWWLVENTLTAAILAGLVAFICMSVRPRPAVRHALWLVVLIKLIAPPLVSWPWTISELWQPVSQLLRTEASTHAEAEISSELHAYDDQAIGDEKTVILIIPAEQTPPAVFEPSAPGMDFQNPAPESLANPVEAPTELPGPPKSSVDAIAAWAVRFYWWGVLGMMLWMLVRVTYFGTRLRMAQPPLAHLVRLVDELASVLDVRPPIILVLSGIRSPFICGLVHTRLVWPQALIDHLSEVQLRGVLLHELAHVRRRDHWIGWLQVVGACLCWWNPLFWFVSRQVRENAELACDAWVVQTLPEGRRAFADALIQVAQVVSCFGTPAPAMSLGARRRREFERRLTMIMSAGGPCRVSLRYLLLVGLVALAAIPGWSLGQQQLAPPATGQPVATPPPVALTPPPSVTEVPPPVAVGQAAPVYALGAVPVDQNDPDARLKAIEQQLEALLKEVHGMRKGGANKVSTPANVYVPPPAPAYPTPGVEHFPGQPATSNIAAGRAGTRRNPPGSPEMLSRTTYELSGAKAEALVALLRDLKGSAVETKIDGDKITVTAAPEAQHVIGQFIAFLQGKSAANTYYQYQAVPVTSYQYQAVPVTAPAGPLPAPAKR
jgi:beta-lactamase regulating signal transducer with metallopeptidase domain